MATNTTLLFTLIKRDVLLRYRGAMLGALWIFLNPLLMMAIFAFVFGEIFQGRWPQQDSGAPFWLILYSGLIAFNVFSEAVSRAPATVRGNPNFVKKIIFPIGILPIVPLGAAVIHGAANYAILVLALAWTGLLRIEILLYPLLLTPLLLLALGMSWFFSAWGVFIKDMNQIIGPLVQMLLFLSPVLYPVSAVPESLQALYAYNPLGAVVETCRAIAIGQPIQWQPWSLSLLAGILIALLGHRFFHHAREEFADVL